MAKHLYLSMIPEALIASMLTPEEFGVYYAVGSDLSYRHEALQIEEGLRRCVMHDDGSPKRSVYITVYRALENVALDAIKMLYLVTQDGRVLGLDPADTASCLSDPLAGLHLYQEIAPVHPLVVSTLAPVEFYDLIQYI